MLGGRVHGGCRPLWRSAGIAGEGFRREWDQGAGLVGLYYSQVYSTKKGGFLMLRQVVMLTVFAEHEQRYRDAAEPRLALVDFPPRTVPLSVEEGSCQHLRPRHERVTSVSLLVPIMVANKSAVSPTTSFIVTRYNTVLQISIYMRMHMSFAVRNLTLESAALYVFRRRDIHIHTIPTNTSPRLFLKMPCSRESLHTMYAKFPMSWMRRKCSIIQAQSPT